MSKEEHIGDTNSLCLVECQQRDIILKLLKVSEFSQQWMDHQKQLSIQKHELYS